MSDAVEDHQTMYFTVLDHGNSVMILIDKESLSVIFSYPGNWKVVNRKNERFYIGWETDSRILLHRIIMNAGDRDRVYFQSRNYTDLRRSNLRINHYTTDESFKEKRRHSYRKMSKEGRYRLIQGMRVHRYSKQWSDHLAKRKKGVSNPNAKVNEDLVRMIRRDYLTTTSKQKELAMKYGISRSAVADIVNYRTWSHVDDSLIEKKRAFQIYPLYSIELTSISFSDPYWQFTNFDLPIPMFTIYLFNQIDTKEYCFVQIVGAKRLYVEIRNQKQSFIFSFEVLFPSILSKKNIYNYVIIQRKPVKQLKRHQVHLYMQIISFFIRYQREEMMDFF